MKKLRQSRAEPVLGTLISFLALRRINTRGQASAHKVMLLSAMAFNPQRNSSAGTERRIWPLRALTGPLPLLFPLFSCPVFPPLTAPEKKKGSSFEAALYSHCVVQQRPVLWVNPFLYHSFVDCRLSSPLHAVASGRQTSVFIHSLTDSFVNRFRTCLARQPFILFVRLGGLLCISGLTFSNRQTCFSSVTHNKRINTMYIFR